MEELWLRLVWQSDCYKGYVTTSALGTTQGCLDLWDWLQLFYAVQAGTSLLWLWQQSRPVRGELQLPVHWIALKIPAPKKKKPKKLSQKQLPCQPLLNPVYLSHMLCKSISLLNSTDSTSNLLKREQDTMNIFWSDTVQYSWPFFPTAVMLQMHFMWVDLVRQGGLFKTLQMQQNIMSTLPDRKFCYASGLDWVACWNIRLNPLKVKSLIEVLLQCF